MLDKLLERLIIRYYFKNAGSRSVFIIQGNPNRTRVKVRGNEHNLKLHLYVAMIRNKYVRHIVLGAVELYRETELDKTDNQ